MAADGPFFELLQSYLSQPAQVQQQAEMKLRPSVEEEEEEEERQIWVVFLTACCIVPQINN